MKMLVYKIHVTRILTLSVTLLTLVSILIFLNPPQKCIQVSVSVQQWQPYLVKRTRVVHAVLDNTAARSIHQNHQPVSSSHIASKITVNTDPIFRTRIVPREDIADTEEIDDNDIDDDVGVGYDNDDNVVDGEDYYGDLPANRVFEDGDFDYNETSPSDIGLISQMFRAYRNGVNATNIVVYSSQNGIHVNVTSGSHRRMKIQPRNITLINVEGVPIVEDSIYWSEELEKSSPKGLSDAEVQVILQRLRTSAVKRVEAPTWNRCGRPKNQYVVFEDDSRACARYRAPHQYLVQGEIMSFYLARLLGIHNVPVVALSAVKEDFKGQWDRDEVKQNLLNSKWETNTTVALIQWIDNLERDKLPPLLLQALVNKTSISSHVGSLVRLPVKKLVELLQWSDLIVFDYITGNYDRVASMQDAAEKEKKPSILHETIHNLVRSKSDGGLWLIDNESGLLDSYSLLYGPAGQDGRFLDFHRQMLDSTCLFRRSTVERIRWLKNAGNAGRILTRMVVQPLEPLFQSVENEEEVWKRLQERIVEVDSHIRRCESYFH